MGYRSSQITATAKVTDNNNVQSHLLDNFKKKNMQIMICYDVMTLEDDSRFVIQLCQQYVDKSKV